MRFVVTVTLCLTVMLCLTAVAPSILPAFAGMELKTAGDKCGKEKATAASGAGRILKCMKVADGKVWTLTAAVAPERDMPGGKPNPGTLYPGRVNRYKKDQEAKVGDPVRLAGRTAWVTSAVGGRVLVIRVKIVNHDSKTKRHDVSQWQLVTVKGQVIDPALTVGQYLASGYLDTGRAVEGVVRFEVSEAGPYFVIYKPDPLNSARGIWRVG